MQRQSTSFYDFADALGRAESSGRYSVKNRFGYLGKYQFGMARLCDLGLTVRDGKRFKWVEGLSEERFLASPALQDHAFQVHCGLLRARILGKYLSFLGTRAGGVTITLSGSVAVCHLLGEGGLRALFRDEDRADAFGTTASSYMRRFGGYDIPETLPTKFFQGDPAC